MRYSLFTATDVTDKDVEACRLDVQAACDAAHIEGTPRIIICPFEALGKWVVAAPVEPKVMKGEVVDTIVTPNDNEEVMYVE